MSITESRPDQPCPKLPLWHTIGLSYSTYFANLAAVLRASWLWLIVMAGVTFLASRQQWSWMAAVVIDLKPGQTPNVPKPPEMTALIGLSNILLLLAGVSIAVAWHRLMILNERPGFSGSNVATGSVWRYIGIGIVIFVIGFLPAAIIMVLDFVLLSPVTGASAPASLVAVLLILVLYVIGAAITLRLSLLLPARATDDLRLRIGDAWRRTRGNTWRLLWGIFFTTVPPLIVAQIALLAVVGFPNPANFANPDFAARMSAVSAVSISYYLLILPIGIGFLSHAYRHFFQMPLTTEPQDG